MYKYLELDSYLSLVPIDILTLLTLVYVSRAVARIRNFCCILKVLLLLWNHLETAMLLPGKYAPKSTEKYEVRSNLRSYKKKEGQR